VKSIGTISDLFGDRHSLLTGIDTCGQRSLRLGNRATEVIGHCQEGHGILVAIATKRVLLK
jgi:hypothetical protein